ncbi:ABC transporter ATP-binding protein [Fibrobacterales bacterium]|nr:ABC transporter ATP-binding protein [Fibrobacterales bacterium]
MSFCTKNLSVGYAFPLASNLSFNFDEGDFIALIGRNGSGKSTFLKTIAGLIKPLCGNITVSGENISAIPPRKLAKQIAFVPAAFPSEVNIKVFDFIALGRTPHTNIFDRITSRDLEIINTAINCLELTEFSNRRVNFLSDGQRGRVSLARALAQDTDILLLDEPTAFLDYPSRIKLFKFLTQLTTPHSALRTGGKTILISTHELDLAKKFSKKILQFTGDGNSTGTALLNTVENTTVEWG